MRLLDIVRSNVKKRADSLTGEDDSSTIRVRPHVIFQPGVGKNVFQRESFFQPLSDINQRELRRVFYIHAYRLHPVRSGGLR